MLSVPLLLVTAGVLAQASDVCMWTQHRQQSLLPTCDDGDMPGLALKEMKEDEWGWTGPHVCVSKYCLWANQRFAGGRGISVITVHENLNLLKAIGVNLEEVDVPSLNPLPVPFLVDEVEGKGLGLRANRTIPRGETFMAFTPVLFVHREFIHDLPISKKGSVLDMAADLLPPATREKFENQMQYAEGTHRVSDVLATNAFQMALPTKDGYHYGNFPEVSRLNHDCRPNSAFYIDDNFIHRTTAVNKIKPGEEITITYLDSAKTRDERRERSRVAWGFECNCPLCSQSEAKVALSDSRLEEIAEIEKKLNNHQSEDVKPATIERLIKLYRLEKLDALISGAYTLAALNYNLLGWDKMAVKYAKMAIEYGTVSQGADAPDVIAMGILARDPKAHFTYKGRFLK